MYYYNKKKAVTKKKFWSLMMLTHNHNLDCRRSEKRTGYPKIK